MTHNKNNIYWICQCNCGKIIQVNSGGLNSGNTKSCGCLRKDLLKKYNKYNLSGEFGIGYASNRDNIKFYFDLEDFELIKNYCWRISNDKDMLARQGNNKEHIKLHRLIMGFPDNNFVIDHIDRNRLDNRKKNLRICSNTENVRNSKIPKNNITGYIGISFHKNSKKYSSRIVHETKIMHLGTFEKIEDAIIARLKKEKELWGEFAPQRNLFKLYNI